MQWDRNAKCMRIYCAGKITQQQGWRPGPWDYGGFGEGEGYYFARFTDQSLGVTSPINLAYTGPFTDSGCGHGTNHGPGSHGAGAQGFAGDGHCAIQAQSAIYARSMRGIDLADLVIAKPTPTSFGTMVEIGYAAAKGKSIVIDLEGQDPKELWFAVQAHNCTDAIEEAVATYVLGCGPERWGAHAEPADRGIVLCESPIEEALYLALRKLGMQVRPQVEIGRYRADFVVGEDLVVECDGHDWHSSREQRTKDAGRDRAIMAAGYRVARFTGTEIHADAARCARDVARLVAK